jgi:hypothetical protein
MTLGQDTEACVAIEQGPFAGNVRVEILVAPEARPERLERAQLEWHHPVPLEDRGVAQLPGHAQERGDLGVVASAGQVLNPKIDRVAEEPARREVRARFLRYPWTDGVQWIDEEHCSPLHARPGSERAKVTEVADAPSLARPDGIELCGPAPSPQRIRKCAPAGAGDHRHAPPVTHHQVVIAVRCVAGEQQPAGALATVLQLDASHPARQSCPRAHKHGRRPAGVDRTHARLDRARTLNAHPPASARCIHVLSLDSPRGPAVALRSAGHLGNPKSVS